MFNNSLISSESHLNSEFNLYNYNIYAPNNINFTADSITKKYNNSCLKIELCKAWKNFKVSNLKRLNAFKDLKKKCQEFFMEAIFFFNLI